MCLWTNGKTRGQSNVFLIMLNFMFWFRFPHLEHANDYKSFTCMSPEIQIPLSLSKLSPNLGLWEYTCICSFLLGIRIKLYYIFFFWVPNFRVISFLSKPWSWSGKCSVFVRSHYFLSSLNKSNALWPLNFLTNFFIHYKKSKRNNRKPT